MLRCKTCAYFLVEHKILNRCRQTRRTASETAAAESRLATDIKVMANEENSTSIKKMQKEVRFF